MLQRSLPPRQVRRLSNLLVKLVTLRPVVASPWKASSLVTPATNVGHAGEIKTRLGEKQNAVQECTETEQTSVEMEDEYYPEIEYIPPSMALDGSWRVFTH